MKRIPLAAALTCGTVLLAACGGSAENHQSAPPASSASSSSVPAISSDTTTTATASDQSSEPGDYRVGQAVPLSEDGITMTVKQVKTGVMQEYSSKRYVGVLLDYRNGSKKTASMGNSMYLRMLDGEGQSMDEGLVTNDSYPGLRLANVTPGRTLKGWVFFEQPKSMKGAYLQFDNMSTSANVVLG